MNIARIATLKLELVGDLVNETICPIIRESTMDNTENSIDVWG